MLRLEFFQTLLGEGGQLCINKPNRMDFNAELYSLYKKKLFYNSKRKHDWTALHRECAIRLALVCG